MRPFAAVVPSAVPDFDRATHRLVEAAPVETGDAYLQQWHVDPLTPQEVAQLLQSKQAELTGAVAAIRWERETGGITIGGVQVATGIDDQNRITSVVANAQLAGIESVEFKAASGFVTLGLDDLRGIAAAIALHVQACFSAERGHYAAIAALQTLADAQTYDTTEGWPAA